jgi:hypothetical protein
LKGFAVSALRPSAATVSALLASCWTSAGKSSNSFRAALIHEISLVFRI